MASWSPLRRAPFGPRDIAVPARPEVLLDASYGKAWPEEASLANAHSARSGRVPLAEGDFAPAQPFGPLARSVEEL